MKVLWTDQAFERLAEIEEYIARDDPATAERFIDRLIDRSQALADHPGLGRTLPELPGSDFRELVEGNYRIVYRLHGDAVAVLTVFEGHRRPPLDDLALEDRPLPSFD
ncbi:type II toxin-antitoxin system RelE/ParE family toxin [Thiocapsa roseopersicina]|uniref:Addiction module toxin, RelE/StbE family n=1 Tax=Thiocapsa roseopersicina TaxID=1058 RepID=A0A1H2ZJS6_THIRO|nr:type II toxin-antitoxin system RelE/ParE family toxin [Thiocapsa roseopersicina]SDX17772.1 addiction module toxin, RelE/StbE family [Thiocapsa roseopersicina]